MQANMCDNVWRRKVEESFKGGDGWKVQRKMWDDMTEDFEEWERKGGKGGVKEYMKTRMP